MFKVSNKPVVRSNIDNGADKGLSCHTGKEATDQQAVIDLQVRLGTEMDQ